MSATTTAGTLSRRSASTRRALRGELAFQLVLLLGLLLALAVLFVLILDVVLGSLPVWQDRGAGFLSSNLSSRASRTGVAQGIRGSMIITLTTALTAVPIGVLTAVWLEEYAPRTRVTQFIDINIRNLAGVPSVVYGIFGLAVFVTVLRPATGGSSVLAAGLTMSTLALPIVIITAAEAIRAVPQSLREGGYGLGATRWQVTRTLVLPNAMPGVLTGIIITFARVIGETAPLLVVGVTTGFLATGDQGLLAELQGAYTALPALVFQFSRQPGNDFVNQIAPATIVVLLAFTLIANAIAIVMRNRFEQR
ncbi:MAG: phosphate ABC transporter permease PstA [Actinomycetes bacterium]